VYEEISPELTEDEAAWLKSKTIDCLFDVEEEL
jgi:hypothetical protein